MGCDGGSIPRRDELVKTKKAEVKGDSSAQQQAAWTTCSLSKQPLQTPIVSCVLGRLYNKSSILQFLIDKTTFGDADKLIPHITSLKDVQLLTLSPNPLAGKKQVKSVIQTAFQDQVEPAQFICPITQKEMNGNSKFSYLASCGCVISNQALTSISTSICLVCSKPFSATDDIVLLNPITPEEIKSAKDRLEHQVLKRKIEKAEKMERKRLEKANNANSKKLGDESESKKRKNDETGGLLTASSSDEERQHVNEKKIKKNKKDNEQNKSSAATIRNAASGININLPDLSGIHAPKSKAVAALYHKDGEGDNKGNYLTRGTFNRY